MIVKPFFTSLKYFIDNEVFLMYDTKKGGEIVNNRLKQLRKSLDLTQQEFADRIGSTQNLITNYESGRRNPSNSVINNICKTFNVSETWLRTGEGEMFLKTGEDELREIARSRGLNDEQYAFLETVMNSPPDDMDAIIRFLQRLAVRMKWISPEGTAAPASAPKAPQDMTNDELLTEFKRQLDDEEKAGATPVASGLKQSETA